MKYSLPIPILLSPENTTITLEYENDWHLLVIQSPQTEVQPYSNKNGGSPFRCSAISLSLGINGYLTS